MKESEKVLMGIKASVLLSCLALSAPGPGALPVSLSILSPQDSIVRDDLDRIVPLPSGVERILSLEPEISRIIVALGAGEKIVGIDFFLRFQDHLFSIIHPRIRDLPVISNQGQELNFEAAIGLRPDIIFSSPSEYRMTESIQSKMRTPVVALASIGKFDNLLREITLLGKILGREERASELEGYFRRRIEELEEAVRTIPPGKKPRIYLSFWGDFLRTPVSYEPVVAASGINLASDLLPSYLGTASTTVQIEQVLRWDPDVILVQGNYPPDERRVSVEGVLADSRLASVNAIRHRRVHYIFGFWYWWDPALVLLETLYLGRLFYPHLFLEFDLEKEGNTIFQKFYKRDGLFTALCKILRCHEWIEK